MGPAHKKGDARSDQMGSTKVRTPSISTKNEECPIQVTLRPDAGCPSFKWGTATRGAKSVLGSRCGEPPNRNRPNVSTNEPSTRRNSLVKRSLSGCHCGEDCIRLSRSPSARAPVTSPALTMHPVTPNARATSNPMTHCQCIDRENIG